MPCEIRMFCKNAGIHPIKRRFFKWSSWWDSMQIKTITKRTWWINQTNPRPFFLGNPKHHTFRSSTFHWILWVWKKYWAWSDLHMLLPNFVNPGGINMWILCGFSETWHLIFIRTDWHFVNMHVPNFCKMIFSSG